MCFRLHIDKYDKKQLLINFSYAINTNPSLRVEHTTEGKGKLGLDVLIAQVGQFEPSKTTRNTHHLSMC